MSDAALTQEPVPQQTTFTEAFAAAPKPVVTYGLIALNVLVFLAMLTRQASLLSPTSSEAIAWGANFGPLTAHGEWWRLITACFVHFGFIHIGMNMAILWQVGIFTERLYGNVRFFLLYLLAGIGGNLLGLFGHPMTVSAGASGAVFGVYGGLLAFLLVQRGVVPSASAWSIAKSAGIFIAYNVIYGLSSPETDMTAHVGGLFTGFLVGCPLARPLFATGQRLYPVRTILVALLGAGMTYLMVKGDDLKLSAQDEWQTQLLAGKSVTIGDHNRVIYMGAASKSDADALAQALTKAQYFVHGYAVVLLSKGSTNSTGPVLSLPTGKAAAEAAKSGGAKAVMPWNDPEYLSGVEWLGVEIAPSVGGPPLSITLLGKEGVPEKTLQIDAHRVVFGSHDSIWYSGSATLTEAKALGAVLQQQKFFVDSQRRVAFAKDQGGASVSFMLKQGAWDNPRVFPYYIALGHQIAPAVGAAPLTVYLVDSNMQRHKALPIN